MVSQSSTTKYLFSPEFTVLSNKLTKYTSILRTEMRLRWTSYYLQMVLLSIALSEMGDNRFIIGGNSMEEIKEAGEWTFKCEHKILGWQCYQCPLLNSRTTHHLTAEKYWFHSCTHSCPEQYIKWVFWQFQSQNIWTCRLRLTWLYAAAGPRSLRRLLYTYQITRR